MNTSAPAVTPRQWTLEIDCGSRRLAHLRQARRQRQLALACRDGRTRRAPARDRAAATGGPGDPFRQERLHRRCRRLRVRPGARAGRSGAIDPCGTRRAAAARGPALPHRRRHQRLLPRRRARTRHGLPSPRLRGRSESHAGPARSDARHSPGLRRHRACGATRRRGDRDGPDADRQEPAARQGAAGRPRRRGRPGQPVARRRQGTGRCARAGTARRH